MPLGAGLFFPAMGCEMGNAPVANLIVTPQGNTLAFEGASNMPPPIPSGFTNGGQNIRMPT
jgi:hypothetical protein